MRTRRKWILLLAVTSAMAVGVAWLAYALALPWLVRREVNTAFRRAGLGAATFELRRVSLFGSDIEHLTTGERDLLKVGALSVRYSPLRALSGTLDAVRITSAQVRIDLDALPQLAAPQPGDGANAQISLPLERVELSASELMLTRGGRELRLPVADLLLRTGDGSARLDLDSEFGGAPLLVRARINLTTGAIDATAGVAGAQAAPLLELLPAEVRAQIEALDGKLDVSATYSRDSVTDFSSLLVRLADASVTTGRSLGVEVGGLAASVLLERRTPVAAPDGQTITARRVSIGQTELDDVKLVFGMRSLRDINVQELSARWAGGIVRADPFHFNPSNPVLATTLTAERVDLNEAISLLTGGRGSGTGTVSGAAPISLDWARAGAGNALVIGQGHFRADGEGNLRLAGASNNFAQLMEQANPDLFTDPELTDLRDDVLEAVQDFDYHLLDVSFQRKDDGTTGMSLTLHGRGRTGRRQPVNLRLNLSGWEQVVNSYLAAKSRVFSNVTQGTP